MGGHGISTASEGVKGGRGCSLSRRRHLLLFQSWLTASSFLARAHPSPRLFLAPPFFLSFSFQPPSPSPSFHYFSILCFCQSLFYFLVLARPLCFHPPLSLRGPKLPEIETQHSEPLGFSLPVQIVYSLLTSRRHD